jgi:hypothetical protein
MNEYPTKEDTESNFNPVLKAALSSLDLDLESELSRYRKLKKKNSLNSDYKPSTPQVIPLESLDLTDIVGLVHQTDHDLKTTNRPISPPDDYLESSVRLLQSLANNDRLGDPERILLNPVKTPWGISSLLMLCLGCILLGSAFIPQSIWAKVPWVKNLVITDSNIPISPPEKPQISRVKESDFFNLNLNNLSTLKVKTNDKPAIKPEEKEAPPLETVIENKPQPTPNQDLATAILSPVLNQVTPQRSPEADTFNATSSISSAQLNNNYYYVFSEYKGDQTLATAKQVIKDAYLVQFPTGKRIQFGAFVNQNDAKNLVDRLKLRGISASVYAP